ncbi:MAG: response regulator transcription factor [Propionibacteriaceae bacterium]|jgi:DNA-binding NarL/FixJ family response regulator|nr:response regulator transcription factor [Propionibacteriaceae bacterium]
MIRVLVVDDHPILRSGLVGLLSDEADMDMVGQAADGNEAVVTARATRPDVIVMDLRLPGLSGAVATRRILAEAAEEDWTPRVLVLTTYEDDDTITEAIEAGASGYLLKSALPDEIISAVRATAQGRSVLAPSVAAAMVRKMRDAATEAALSPRELEVLSLVADGLSNAEIGQELWVEPSTVKTHLEHIYAKLGVAGRIKAVQRARERNLI